MFIRTNKLDGDVLYFREIDIVTMRIAKNGSEMIYMRDGKMHFVQKGTIVLMIKVLEKSNAFLSATIDSAIAEENHA